jgi:hypothetical protein
LPPAVQEILRSLCRGFRAGCRRHPGAKPSQAEHPVRRGAKPWGPSTSLVSRSKLPYSMRIYGLELTVCGRGELWSTPPVRSGTSYGWGLTPHSTRLLAYRIEAQVKACNSGILNVVTSFLCANLELLLSNYPFIPKMAGRMNRSQLDAKGQLCAQKSTIVRINPPGGLR